MSHTGTTEKLLRAVDVGRILDCSKRSVYRYAYSSKIPAPLRLSGSTKWKMSDVMLFLECNCDMAKYKARKEAEQC
ncbi:hypothetical protein ES707_22329 [subsurface metagenome]